MFESLLKFGVYRKVLQNYNFLTLKSSHFSVLRQGFCGIPGNLNLNSCASPFSDSYNNNLSNLNIIGSDLNDIKRSVFNYYQLRGPKIVKPRDVIRFWKIRPGDKVVVISGKDKGKTGEVLMCDRLRNQVKVKGCNMRKLLVDSQVVQIEKKIHYSNVQLLDHLLNVGTRVSIRYSHDNKPLRVSKKSGYVIPWPSKRKKEPRDCIEGEKDTSPEEALRRTYDYEKVFWGFLLVSGPRLR
ncbi:50s ribosomal subunit l24, putative [Theileria annulata]|uniref:Large ribosomal subunit protein uL24c n=1 Tax=Theileria annulata TaxID=5874 RepID=Q4UDN8_THEAN|nr:50s ribosomal subunit l24, putative [Theileria annulata]CAI74801.1 50s ribosomal subunit l24, putative [Theileria annulata]|eukprot:XP_952533.1 50s ribosomal subunit l24, putative [Theileria annulata]